MDKITVERILRGLAGSVILISILLYFLHSVHWIWVILFVGINLLQSAFTNWCPAKSFIEKMGVRK